MKRGRSKPSHRTSRPNFSQASGAYPRKSGAPRTNETSVRAAGHVASQLAREYWEALNDPQGARLYEILRNHPEELGLLNDFQRYRLKCYLEGLARWHGWLKGHSQRLLEWPLLLASLLESDKIDDTQRNWAARCDLNPDRLIALGDAPNWAVRGDGYRRVVGSQKANVDPWSLLPGWIRTHLPQAPVEEQSKIWHSRILEGFQARPHQWLRIRDLGKQKTIHDNLEKLEEQTGQQAWRARKVEGAARWPRHVDLPRPAEPWPWIIQDFSDQMLGHA
ncbi:MAG: Ribosomal small subunit methyltransferase, partial [Planctomycetota bacterium]